MMNLECKMRNYNPRFKNPRRAGFRSALARERAGFTLLEVVVSLGIFSVVIITAIGAVIAIKNAQLKASRIQVIQDNLRFTLESMTREMRTASSFSPGGSAPAYTQLTFTRSDNVVVSYCSQNGTVRKMTGGSTVCSVGSPVTSDDVLIDRLTFYVLGQAAGPSDGQPRVTTSLQAHSRDPKLGTSFRIQTTVTQRLRDL